MSDYEIMRGCMCSFCQAGVNLGLASTEPLIAALGLDKTMTALLSDEEKVELNRKLELLRGPNGYALYKAMLARQSK